MTTGEYNALKLIAENDRLRDQVASLKLSIVALQEHGARHCARRLRSAVSLPRDARLLCARYLEQPYHRVRS